MKTLRYLTYVCVLLVMTGCMDDGWNTPKTDAMGQYLPYSGPAVNTTIADLKAKYATLIENNQYDMIDDDVIIEGVVMGDDRSGNIYNSLYIQDSTGGLQVSISQNILYVDYPVGQRVVINCKGLTIGGYGKSAQLGVEYYNPTKDSYSVGRMDKSIWAEHATPDGPASKNYIFNPIVVSSKSDLTSSMVGCLVRLDNVNFENEGITAFAPEDEADAGYGVTRALIFQNDAATLDVRNSIYSSFANKILPKGTGSVLGILGSYNGSYQLTIRDYDTDILNMQKVGGTMADLKGDAPAVNSTIADLYAKYQTTIESSAATTVDDNLVIQAVVVGNDNSGNIYKQLILQDATGGITISVDQSSLATKYAVGQKVIINCKGLYVGGYGWSTSGGVLQRGVIQLGALYNGGIGRMSSAIWNLHAWTSGTASVNNLPTPTVITSLDEIKALSPMKAINSLVILKNVHFANAATALFAPTATTEQSVVFSDESTAVMRTSNFADFHNRILPEGTGSMTCILSCFKGTWQLTLREYKDLVGFTDVNVLKVLGTKDNPYSVTSARTISTASGTTQAWVEGYIVGANTNAFSITTSNAVFGTTGAKNSAILLAASPNETNLSKCLVIGFASDSGTNQSDLNLVDHPENLGKKVKISGTLKYAFSLPGLKTITNYAWE